MPAREDIYADKVEDVFPMLHVVLKVNSLSPDCISGAATAQRERKREGE